MDKPALFLKVLRCSNNLMQKMTSITPSNVWFKKTDTQFSSDTLLRWASAFLNQMLSMKLSIRKYLSKILTRNIDHYEGFSQNYQRFRPFTAILSICNQRSLTNCTNYKQRHLVTQVLPDVYRDVHIFAPWSRCPVFRHMNNKLDLKSW